MAIPDNDASGAQSTISVPDRIEFIALTVEVELEHTYIGDLVLELSHGGRTVTLQSREGGSQQNLLKSFSPIGFGGLNAQGDWVLKVTDQAARDEGSIKRWTVVFATNAVPTDSLSYSSSDGLAVPDDDPAGVSSSIQVAEDRTARSVVVAVDITHTYIGDLVIELEHDGELITLQAQEGGSAQDLRKEFRPIDFNGQSTKGTWKLLVSDRAAADTGRLNSWSLTLGI